MRPEIDRLCGESLAALFNGAYQGTLVAVAILAYLRWNRCANASTRHALLLITLWVVTMLPLAHAVSAWRDRSERPIAAVSMRLIPEELSREGNAISRPDPTIPAPTPTKLNRGLGRPLKGPQVQSPARGSTTILEPSPSNTVAPRLSAEAGRPSTTWATQARGWLKSLRIEERLGKGRALVTGGFKLAGLKPYAPGIIAIWGLISGTLLARLGWQFYVLKTLKRRALPAPAGLSDQFTEVCQEMKLLRGPRLLLSPSINIPLAVGFAQPAVLLPADLADSSESEAIRLLLRHEVAHLARRDDWANLAQLTAQALFFFHPAVWWLSARMVVEREIACDDRVLEAHRNPRDYALLLTEFVRRRPGRRWVTASAAWTHKSQLKERIDMILNTSRTSSPLLARTRVGAFTTCAVLLALVGLRAGPRVALGDATPLPTLNPAAPTVAVTPPSTQPPSAAPRLGEVESGPRPKINPARGVLLGGGSPGGADSDLLLPPGPGTPGAGLALPTPPTLPLAATEPMAPLPVAVDPPSGAVPQPGFMATQADVGMEQRLARLEKLVHELLKGQAKGESADTMVLTGDSEDQAANIDAREAALEAQREALEAQKEALEAAREAKQAADESRQAHQEAQREAAEAQKQAAEAAEQAARDAMKAQEAARLATRDAAQTEKLERDRADGGSTAGSMSRHNKAMSQTRNALIHEQAALKRRLVEIERQLSHLKVSEEPGALEKQ